MAELDEQLNEFGSKCRALVSEATQQAERVKQLRTTLAQEMVAHEGTVRVQVERIEQLKKLVEQSAGAAVVKLNVGGTAFEVARSTLAAQPLSFFGLLLTAEPGADGSYFVDRSAAVFDLVLQHLRGMDLRGVLLTTERGKLEQLLSDATHYGLDKLVAQLRSELEERWTISPTVNGTLLDGGMSMLKTGDMGGKACIAVGTSGWCEGVHSFTVVFSGEGAHVGVGVTRGGVHQTDLLRNVHLFYALDCGNGRAIGVGGVAKQVMESVPPGGFAPGSRVAVRVDLARHTVSFGLNGVWQEPAFANIQPGTYYPYFFIGQMEKKLTLVDR